MHYSIKGFFRPVPNALLTRYFKTKGLFSEGLCRNEVGQTSRLALLGVWRLSVVVAVSINLPTGAAERKSTGVVRNQIAWFSGIASGGAFCWWPAHFQKSGACGTAYSNPTESSIDSCFYSR